MKTYSAKPSEVTRNWHLINADGKTLGRIATEIANLLQGKHKPMYTAHIDTGDAVVVINAAKVKLTGNKEATKMYYSHSGYSGGLKEVTYAQQMAKDPAKVIEFAVAGMLPKNKLREERMLRLKVYAGEEHPHSAQKPQEFEKITQEGKQ